MPLRSATTQGPPTVWPPPALQRLWSTPPVVSVPWSHHGLMPSRPVPALTSPVGPCFHLLPGQHFSNKAADVLPHFLLASAAVAPPARSPSAMPSPHNCRTPGWPWVQMPIPGGSTLGVSRPPCVLAADGAVTVHGGQSPQALAHLSRRVHGDGNAVKTCTQPRLAVLAQDRQRQPT